MVESDFISQDPNASSLDDVIANHIIDIWVVIEDLPETVAETSENSQAGQEQNAVVADAKAKQAGQDVTNVDLGY